MKVICNYAHSEHCHGACPDQKSCSHILPHYLFKGHEIIFSCRNLKNEEIYKVQCVPHLEAEGKLCEENTPILSTSQLLTAEPRELTLEEIAVAAMAGIVGNFNYEMMLDENIAKQSYDIAEAMKAEKAKREKKNG